MKARLARGTLFFLLGFLALNAGILALYQKEEAFPLESSERGRYDFVVWRLKHPVNRDEEVVVRAQHSLAGDAGRFRFVVFQKGRRDKPPEFLSASDVVTVSDAGGWSEWRFKARRPHLFVGIAWDQEKPPIYLRKGRWRNQTQFFDYAFVGKHHAGASGDETGGKIQGEDKKTGTDPDWKVTGERYGICTNLEAKVAGTEVAGNRALLLAALILLGATIALLLWPGQRLWPGWPRDPLVPSDLDRQPALSPMHGHEVAAGHDTLRPSVWLSWFRRLSSSCLSSFGRLSGRRQCPTAMDLVWLVAGVVLAYRLWGAFLPAWWNWGSFTIAYLPTWLRVLLLAGSPLFCVVGTLLPRGFLQKRFPSQRLVFWGSLGLLLSLTWLLPCRRHYGDGAFGYVGVTHGPLLFDFFRPLELLGAHFGMGSTQLARLASRALLIPFLFYLRRIVSRVEEPERPSWLWLLFFLSISTVQDFFGYTEIYAVPMVCGLVFVWYAWRCLEGSTSLFVPTFFAFCAYLLHVAEAFLIFPLAYLWWHRVWQGSTSWRRALVVALAAGVSALVLLGVTSYGVYVLKYDSVLEAFTAKYPYYGYEFLWGGPKARHVSAFLPLTGYLKHPSGLFAIPSIENLLKVSNFVFHYSAFCLFLPLLMVAGRKLEALRDPKIVFLWIGFVAYGTFLVMLRPGFFSPIMDWDLLSPLSLLGALLTYILCVRGRQYRVIFVVAGINLLQTIPWLLVNHYASRVPW